MAFPPAEVELLDAEVRPGFRTGPELKNGWRWTETYLLLFVIVVVAGVWWFVTGQILPLVR